MRRGKAGLKSRFSRDQIKRPNQLLRRMNMHDESIRPMSVENVEEFDVWIFDSQDLAVSIVPHQAAWRATTEEYDISQQ